MKRLLLLPAVLAAFALGFLLMARIDRFIKKNRRLIHTENRQNKAHIRIAAEAPMLLEQISPQLKAYSRANPFVSFSLHTEAPERILHALMCGTLDLAILGEEGTCALEARCAALQIPCPTGRFPLGSTHTEGRACVLWDGTRPSRARDRVLFAIEAEYCSLQCGYADYLP